METRFCLIVLLHFFGSSKGQEQHSCFRQGECANSNVLNYTYVFDEFECIEKCKTDAQCAWFTYSPNSDLCYLFEDCNDLDLQNCPECLSGEGGCHIPQPKCGVRGKCLDTVLHFDAVPTLSKCLNECQATKECRWYTFNLPKSECILFSGCNLFDKSDKDFFSGERRCGQGYSKVLVTGGLRNGSALIDVEVVDLSSHETVCQNLPNLPHSTYHAAGGLGFKEKPTICSGFMYGAGDFKHCYTYENGFWQSESSLNEDRTQFAITRVQFPNSTAKLVATGGYKPSDIFLNTSEILTEGGWEMFVDLPVAILAHCVVQINSTSIILISGKQGDPLVFSPRTFIYNSENGIWTDGPSLFLARRLPSCSLIKRNGQSEEKSVIVIGGQDFVGRDNGIIFNTSEILDLASTEWRNGPSLPFGISGAEIVEDQFGGVVLIGGYNGTEIDKFFRLAHADDDVWVEMPQKLTTSRTVHTAFLIPDEITDCN